MTKSKFLKFHEEIANGVTQGFQKVSDTVVGGYTKLEDKFVGRYLTRDDETVAEAKKRLKREQEELRKKKAGL